MDQNIPGFEILSKSQKDLVQTPSSVVEPTVPIRPSRVMYIGMGVLASLGLGIGLVCLMEHVDHSVRVPEHVTQGLILPLLGVVPRIRRTALTHRGGHLWTAGTPDSIEADAFRNIRASLLGIADRRGPIVTLLVTSPKAGDGKSTAALNLAATCARAGERTLLLDVDLRRPTLADVFPPDPTRTARCAASWTSFRVRSPGRRRCGIRSCGTSTSSHRRPARDPHRDPGHPRAAATVSALSQHYDRVILTGRPSWGWPTAGCWAGWSTPRSWSSGPALISSGRCSGQGDARAVARGDRRSDHQRPERGRPHWSSYGYDARLASPGVLPGPGRREPGIALDHEADDGL